MMNLRLDSFFSHGEGGEGKLNYLRSMMVAIVRTSSLR